MRFWYLVTTAGAHVQAFCGSENQPHGQGYTQSDKILVLGEWQKADLKSIFQVSTPDTWSSKLKGETSIEAFLWKFVYTGIRDIFDPLDRSCYSRQAKNTVLP